MTSIVRISKWPEAAIREIVAESEGEGFRFVRRASEEWASGLNRFSNEGKALICVFEADRLLAIGGVSHSSERCGRMRRLYVRREERGKGIGRKLIQHILEFAAHYYSRFEVRCDTTAANQFYCALGFSRTAAKPGITHQIDLREAPNQSNTP